MIHLELTSVPMTLAERVALFVLAVPIFYTHEAEAAFPEACAADLDKALTACAEWDGGKTWTAKGVE